MSISGRKRTDQLGEPEGSELLDLNYQKDVGSNTLCTALVESNIARNKQDAQPLVELRQLLATQSYKEVLSLSDK